MTALRHLVVLRFSAMGDVALTVPVIRGALNAHPQIRITVITRPLFARFFSCIRLEEHEKNRLTILAADVKDRYAGLWGILKLARDISGLRPDVILDLHDHLRTIILRNLLKSFGTPVVVFDKGRRAKKSATGAQRGQHRRPLTHTSDRYRNAFAQAGLPFPIPSGPHVAAQRPNENDDWFVPGIRRIGIAPLAAHPTKQWPIERFTSVIEAFRNDPHVRFLVFGGAGDRETLNMLVRSDQQVWNTAGRFTLEEELGIMLTLDAMVTVDSSNMHMAGLCGVPVVSVWGGTHTVTGFGPAFHPKNEILEIPPEELPCRPCSTFGKSSCARGDLACLRRITADEAVTAIRRVLGP